MFQEKNLFPDHRRNVPPHQVPGRRALPRPQKFPRGVRGLLAVRPPPRHRRRQGPRLPRVHAERVPGRQQAGLGPPPLRAVPGRHPRHG